VSDHFIFTVESSGCMIVREVRVRVRVLRLILELGLGLWLG
jgi:hypothetical protein